MEPKVYWFQIGFFGVKSGLLNIVFINYMLRTNEIIPPSRVRVPSPDVVRAKDCPCRLLHCLHRVLIYRRGLCAILEEAERVGVDFIVFPEK